MGTLWLICGAGSGVGKTHLAERLCNVLTGSVYCKTGCSPKKKNKSENFFNSHEEAEKFIKENRDRYSHIIVESNSIAKKNLADITIFIDSIKGVTESRDDACFLENRADIVVPVKEDVKSVFFCFTDGKTAGELVEIINSHSEWLLKKDVTVHNKVWLENKHGHILGPGLVRILRKIEQEGSLKKAVDAEKISYRHAWGEIKTAEENIGKKIIITHSGGNKGGGTSLTPYGHKIIDIYKKIEHDVSVYADDRFSFYMETFHEN